MRRLRGDPQQKSEWRFAPRLSSVEHVSDRTTDAKQNKHRNRLHPTSSRDRSTSTSTTRRLNILFLDAKWDNTDNERKEDTPFLNTVGRGTGRQAVARVPDRESGTLREASQRYWLRAYGRAKRLVSDQQMGILRVVFADRASAEGAKLGPTSGVWKRTCYKVRLSEPILTAPNQDELVDANAGRTSESSGAANLCARAPMWRTATISPWRPCRVTPAGDRALGMSISLRLAARSAYATESVLDRLDRAKNRRSTPHRGGW